MPGLSFDIRAVRIGVFVKVGAFVSGTVEGQNDLCVEAICWKGAISAGGNAEGGLAAEDAAKILSITGSLSAGLAGEGAVDCVEVSFKLSMTGLKGKITVAFFDGFIEVGREVELVPDQVLLGPKTFPLPTSL